MTMTMTMTTTIEVPRSCAALCAKLAELTRRIDDELVQAGSGAALDYGALEQRVATRSARWSAGCTRRSWRASTSTYRRSECGATSTAASVGRRASTTRSRAHENHTRRELT
jgi:hypothetical protein